MFHAFDADELPPGMIRGKSFFEEIRRDILKKKKNSLMTSLGNGRSS